MFYIVGIAIAFFLALLLFAKKKKTQADYILLAWLSIIGLHLLLYYTYISGAYLNHLFIIPLAGPLPMLHGPLLFLYVLASTSTGKLTRIHLLHFLPVALLYGLYAKFFFLTPQEQAVVFLYDNSADAGLFGIKALANIVSGIAYVALSTWKLLAYRKRIVDHFSDTEKINFSWLLYLIAWIAVIWSLVMFSKQDQLIFGATVVFVVWLGYFGIRQLGIFHKMDENYTDTLQAVGDTKLLEPSDHEDDPEKDEEESPAEDSTKIKYYKSSLSDAAASRIYEALKELILNEKPYKIPELTLSELAKKLDTHPNNLSQVINSFEHKNFYDYINEKRSEEFLRLWSLPENQKYTLLALALECGFNSKASFNRNFKKFTGFSPTEYQEQIK